jgi:hypothetical protein
LTLASLSLQASSESPPTGTETAAGLDESLNQFFVPLEIVRHSRYPPLTVDLSPTLEQMPPSDQSGRVVGVVATARIQDERVLAINEIFELQALYPFRFLARTRTLYVFPAATAFTVHLVAVRLAVQVFVPTFTCDCRIGDFGFVPAIEKITVTSTVPFDDFAADLIN